MIYGDAEVEFQKKSQKQRRKQIEHESKQRDQALLNQVNNSQSKHVNVEDTQFDYNQQVSLSSKDFYESLKKYELKMLNDLNFLDRQSKFQKNKSDKHDSNGIFSPIVNNVPKTGHNTKDNMSKDILRYEKILSDKKQTRKIKKDIKVNNANLQIQSMSNCENNPKTDDPVKMIGDQNSIKNVKYVLKQNASINSGKINEARNPANRNNSRDVKGLQRGQTKNSNDSINSNENEDCVNSQEINHNEKNKKLKEIAVNSKNNLQNSNKMVHDQKKPKLLTMKTTLSKDEKGINEANPQRDTLFTQSNKRKPNGSIKKNEGGLPDLLYDVDQMVGQATANGSSSTGLNFPKVTCKAFCLMDTKRKELVWGKNIKVRREVASLTKIMTCLVTLNFIQTNNVDIENVYYYVSEEAGNTKGTTARLKPYDFVCLKDLLYGLMLPSGNDAAVTLAENVGTHMYLSSYEYKVKKRQPFYDDSRDEKLQNPEKLFYEEMNKFAEKIGMDYTNYANPSGLVNPENYSCAQDQCKISQFAQNDKLFREVVKTKFYTGQIERDHKEVDITWENTNKLLDRGYKGVKTGITSVAGPCLSSYYETDKIGICCIVLGCKVLADRFNDCDLLTQWAVRNYQTISQVPVHMREKDPRTVF